METIMIDSNKLPDDLEKECNIVRFLTLMSSKIELFSRLAVLQLLKEKCAEGDKEALFFEIEINRLDEIYKVPLEKFKSMHKRMCQLKMKKCRSTAEIKIYNMLRQFFVRLIGDIDRNNICIMEKIGFEQLKPYRDNRKIHSNLVLFDNADRHQDLLQELITKTLADKNAMFTLYGFATSPSEKKGVPFFFQEGHLLHLPPLCMLPFHELEFTRASLQKGMEKIGKKIEAFRAEVEEQEVTEKNANKLDRMVSRWASGVAPELKDELDRQLFITKANVSSGNQQSACLKIAITSRNNLIELFLMSNILSPSTAQIMRQAFTYENCLHKGCILLVAG